MNSNVGRTNLSPSYTPYTHTQSNQHHSFVTQILTKYLSHARYYQRFQRTSLRTIQIIANIIISSLEMSSDFTPSKQFP